MKILLVRFGWFGRKHYKVLSQNGHEVIGIVDIAFGKESIQKNFSQDDFHVNESEEINLDNLTKKMYSDIDIALNEIGSKI